MVLASTHRLDCQEGWGALTPDLASFASSLQALCIAASGGHTGNDLPEEL